VWSASGRTLFYPLRAEHRGGWFLLTVCNFLPDYTASHLGRQQSSKSDGVSQESIKDNVLSTEVDGQDNANYFIPRDIVVQLPYPGGDVRYSEY
jgi:hypothetical protein